MAFIRRRCTVIDRGGALADWEESAAAADRFATTVPGRPAATNGPTTLALPPGREDFHCCAAGRQRREVLRRSVRISRGSSTPFSVPPEREQSG